MQQRRERVSNSVNLYLLSRNNWQVLKFILDNGLLHFAGRFIFSHAFDMHVSHYHPFFIHSVEVEEMPYYLLCSISFFSASGRSLDILTKK